jgi:hypothetical protein
VHQRFFATMGEAESAGDNGNIDDSISKDDIDDVANNDEKMSNDTSALKDASKQYGLPPGWTVKVIVSSRNKSFCFSRLACFPYSIDPYP